MKIAIVTLFGYINYGNRLQNYAVQEILKRRGIEVETLVFYPQFYKRILKNSIKMILSYSGRVENVRMKNFYKFSKKNIPIKYISNRNKLDKIEKKYDYFIVGSDQVWNPNLRRKERDFFFLQFVPPEKRLCIAPSFGVTAISESDYDFFVQALDSFKYLSSREADGVNLIKKLVKKEAVHLIDPTLALNKREWEEVMKPCKLPENKYLIKAFLGKVSGEREKAIDLFAKENKLEIIDIFSKNERFYKSDPAEFLYLINKAEFMCTDSFHCTAFSINFNVPFYVFDRHNEKFKSDGTFSRLTSLLKKLGLEKYYQQELKSIDLCYDFKQANQVLEEERKNMEQYLDKILS